MIKDFKPRLYQETIFNTCINNNTLIILPTGLGKTNIFIMLAAHRLKQFPNSKIMLLGPTRPLIDQYKESILKNLEIKEEEIAIFTGFVPPKQRQELFKKSKIILSTPQGLENDIITNKINFEEVSLLGFDEAHRAVGDYSYVFLAKEYHKKARFPKIIGLTASPGVEMEKINEVMQNLYIEAIEVKTEDDSDVSPYVQKTDLKWVEVELPEEIKEVKKIFETLLSNALKELKNIELIPEYNTNTLSKKDVLSLQATLQAKIAHGEKDFDALKGLSICARIMKIQHAQELLETQDVDSVYEYIQKIYSDGLTSKVKAIQTLITDPDFKTAYAKIMILKEKKILHPKIPALKKIIEEKISTGKKAIIFTQYRNTAKTITEHLNPIKDIKAEIFVGQAKKKDTGLSQKKQKETLKKFEEGQFNILVATSVAEEGLDIPKVDYVIFYEPIPSAIRTIQRRGRTGRLEEGNVIILFTKGTRDESYRWSAHHKEKNMYKNLEKLKKSNTHIRLPQKEVQTKIDIKEENIKITADYREKASQTIKELINLGAKITLEQLEIADYVVSARVGIEFKNVKDFVDSIMDNRILHQLKNLKKYEKPLFIIEGEEDIYSVRNIHPNAIRGMIATITVSYGVPIIYTKNPKETASILYIIAKREQEEGYKDFNLHSAKPTTLKEQQEYLIQSIPQIGPQLSKNMLKKFGSVKKIINADEKELKNIDGLGEKIAKKIREIIEEEYKDE